MKEIYKQVILNNLDRQLKISHENIKVLCCFDVEYRENFWEDINSTLDEINLLFENKLFLEKNKVEALDDGTLVFSIGLQILNISAIPACEVLLRMIM